jgi:serine/threonine-protein kinase
MTDPLARLKTALADRYAIQEELGAGGMTTVYLAEDLKHDRKVAVKVLRPELAAVLGAERFVQEIKTTAGLQHPHIQPLFDSGQAVVPPLRSATLSASRSWSSIGSRS